MRFMRWPQTRSGKISSQLSTDKERYRSEVVFSDQQSDAWHCYDPDTDDYDVSTAPVSPPSAAHQELVVVRQMKALLHRIAMGGDSCIIQHYQRIYEELRGASQSDDRDSNEDILYSNSRSQNSLASTLSTCCSDDDAAVSSSRTSRNRPIDSKMLEPSADAKRPQEAQALLPLLEEVALIPSTTVTSRIKILQGQEQMAASVASVFAPQLRIKASL